jgi:hypothetical protein
MTNHSSAPRKSVRTSKEGLLRLLNHSESPNERLRLLKRAIKTSSGRSQNASLVRMSLSKLQQQMKIKVKAEAITEDAEGSHEKQLMLFLTKNQSLPKLKLFRKSF